MAGFQLWELRRLHVEFSRLADDLRKAEIKGCSFKPDLITPMFRENMQTKVLVRLLDRFESEYVFLFLTFLQSCARSIKTSREQWLWQPESGTDGC